MKPINRYLAGMKTVCLFMLCSLLVLGVQAQSKKQKAVLGQISAAMQEQENCWNQGDVRCFMKHYWPSDSLRFIGRSGLTYGWQQTLDNYLSAYPNREAMGKLTFTNLSMEFVDKQTVFVVGKWKLARNAELKDLEGHYSLLWKNRNGRWVIVVDHSS